MIRIGKFFVNGKFIKEGGAQEVFGIMAFVPYKVEYLVYEDKFEYIGVSHLFNPLEEGGKVPVYRIEISEHEDPDIDNIIVKAVYESLE